MTEQELLVDCLNRLNGIGIPYMVTGSMASNYWGIPRTTHDLDFVVQLKRETISDVVAAFDGDYFIQESSVRGALRPPYQFNAIDNRSALKVDFWNLKREPFDEQMFARRTSKMLFGVDATIATAEDILLHKLYWHSLTPSDRQLGDAAGIVSVQGDALDKKYLDEWAEKLGVDETLQKIFDGHIRPKST